MHIFGNLLLARLDHLLKYRLKYRIKCRKKFKQRTWSNQNQIKCCLESRLQSHRNGCSLYCFSLVQMHYKMPKQQNELDCFHNLQHGLRKHHQLDHS